MASTPSCAQEGSRSFRAQCRAFVAGPWGARMLCFQTPGGGEEFYRTASEPARGGQPAIPVDFDRIRQAAAATGTMRVVGPPPFQPVGAKPAAG